VDRVHQYRCIHPSQRVEQSQPRQFGEFDLYPISTTRITSLPLSYNLQPGGIVATHRLTDPKNKDIHG
jgi:hypothetical protein